MRTFISLDLEQDIVAELVKIQCQIKKQLPIQTKYIPHKQMHLTLHFYGDVNLNLYQVIYSKIKKFKYPSFYSRLGKIGFFKARHSKVIWIQLNDIGDLYNELSIKLGLNNPNFVPHITLARVKGLKVVPDFSLINYNKKTEFLIKSFSIIKSTLTQEGPLYEVLEQINLK